MEDILIGTVSEEEKMYIKRVNGKLMALEELISTLSHTDLSKKEFENLNKSIDTDLYSTKQLIGKWWLEMCAKYNWNKKNINQYRIFFDSNKVYKI